MIHERSTILAAALLISAGLHAQLTVQGGQNFNYLVQEVLVGNCVDVSNVTFNGLPGDQIHEQIGTFDGTNADLGVLSGLILATGDINVALGPNDQGGASLGGGNFGANDPDLDQLSGVNTNDRASLEFDFVPNGSSITFRYVFASEEYNEYVCATVNDAFGFFLSGPGINGPYSNNSINLALIPGSEVPISINTVNNGTPGSAGFAQNCADLDPNWQQNNIYYVDNTGSTTIQFDGQTVVLTATAEVQCDQVYHIKLVIADGGDTVFDSGVFLEAGSFSSEPVVPTLEPNAGIDGNTIFESCFDVQVNFLRTGCDISTSESIAIEIGGTATPGVDYFPEFPAQIDFDPGVESIPFTFTVPIDADDTETLLISLSSILPCTGLLVVNDFEFVIEAAPELVVTGDTLLIDCDETAVLTPVVTGGLGGFSYSWSNGGTGPTSEVNPTEASTYTVTVTDTCEVQNATSFQVNITPPAPLTMNILGLGTVMEGCESTQVNIIRPQGTLGELLITLTTSGTAENNSDYVLPASVVIPDGNFNVLVPFDPLDDQIDEGQETVMVTGSYTDDCGRTVTSSVTINIVDAPVIFLEGNEYFVECGLDSMLLAVTASGGVGALTITWDNEGEIVGDEIWATVNTSSGFLVTATDACGRTATTTVNVVIDCEVIIPNVFTPNGDSYNDLWEIEGIQFTTNYLRIFNRWGQVVFETQNYRNTWRAPNIPDGTYFYEIVVDRHEKPYTGHLTILRN